MKLSPILNETASGFNENLHSIHNFHGLGVTPGQLLLLLHLLGVNGGAWLGGRLLGFIDEHGPVLGNGQLAIEGEGLFSAFDVDGNVKLAVRPAAEDAVGGRNVEVVAADGGADVALLCDQIIGGIEADPA